MRDDPRLSKYPIAGPSKEDAEQAHRSGRFDMGAAERSFDSGTSSEKEHQEERRRAAAWMRRKVKILERVRPRSKGLTRKGKERGELKLHELMQAKERAPSTLNPPNGSRKASSPDSALFPPDSPPLSSLRGAASKTTKNRWPSSGPRKTHGQSFNTSGVPLPLAEPPSFPNGTPVSSPTPFEGITRTP